MHTNNIVSQTVCDPEIKKVESAGQIGLRCYKQLSRHARRIDGIASLQYQHQYQHSRNLSLELFFRMCYPVSNMEFRTLTAPESDTRYAEDPKASFVVILLKTSKKKCVVEAILNHHGCGGENRSGIWSLLGPAFPALRWLTVKEW